MHELKIAQNIIAIAADELARRQISTAVRVIHFKAGQMHATIPETLMFNFDTIKSEIPQFAHAVLSIEIIPLRIKCHQCQNISELDEPVFECRHCHGTDLEIINGQEMLVDNIEMEDG